MKSWVVVALVVGCGGAKSSAPIATAPPVPTPLALQQVDTHVREPHSLIDPAPHATTAPVPSAGSHGALAWPLPPALDLQAPTVEEYGRWPLTIAEHPALEPHFDIASALADGAMTWTELCARGAQHRHLAGSQELVDYLAAWCDIERHDFPAAVGKLGTVRRSTTRGLAHAVIFDVAAITAAHGDARDLESFLRRGGFLTLEEVDLVAAAYFEIGRLADATEANRLAIQMDYAPTERARCARMLRAIDDAEGSDRDELVATLNQIAHPSFEIVPRCAAEDAAYRCSRAGNCIDAWVSDGKTTNRRLVEALVAIRRTWPEYGASGTGWSFMVNTLVHSGPPREKYALLIPAAKVAVRASDCDSSVLERLQKDLRIAEEILAPKLAPTATRDDIEVHDYEAVALSATDRADLRSRIHAIADEVHAINRVSLSRMVCLDELAKLPPMVP